LGAEKIDRIVARGNVRFVQEDRVATGQEAIYYQNRNEVVLRGNPQLWRAENTLKGARIIFNLKTNKVLVESSPKRRVEALLYSKGTPGGKASLPFSPKPLKGRQP
jgi:lipopolysaccharide export system protein LptA